MSTKLFNRKLLYRNRLRKRYFRSVRLVDFVFRSLGTRLNAMSNKNFQSILVIGGYPNLHVRFNSIEDFRHSATSLYQPCTGIYRHLDITSFDISFDVDNPQPMPFEDEYFDLVIDVLHMSLVNNIPRYLGELARILKPDGVMIASLFGESNLANTYGSFMEYDSKKNLYQSRFHPNINMETLAHLTSSHFINVVTDTYSQKCVFQNMIDLYRYMATIGQTNILLDNSKKYITNPYELQAIEDILIKEYGEICLDFQILSVLGIKLT